VKSDYDLEGQQGVGEETWSLGEGGSRAAVARMGAAGAFVARGDVLAGRYELQSEIGSGGSSRVFRAYDRATKSAVAVKILIGRTAVGPDWMQRLGRELRLGRRGRHPNVCAVFDLMEADGCRFLTMELATGGTLRDTLQGVPDCDWKERIADARDVLAGTAALHADGIVHRDIKPENVLRRGDGRLVVSDFGLAVVPGTTTFMSGYSGAVGTPSYMAPEIALGGDATMASDVFAVGVILHEVFFGHRPEWETTKRGRFVKPPAIRKGSRIERSMSRLCLECLEPLAPRRPQNASELKKKYERAVLGRYRTFKGAIKAGKWGLVAGLVLAVAASGTVAWLSRRSTGMEEATLVGRPADWSRRASLVTRRDGAIHCVYPSPDGQTIGLIAGTVREAVKLDLRNGQSGVWPLAADTYQTDCPQFSSDGRSLLYWKDGQIVVADALGSSPRVLGRGYFPRWLPSDNEVVHAFDSRRLASTDLVGTMSLLSEVSLPNAALLDVMVDAQAKQVVAHYALTTEMSSVLVFFDIGAGNVRRQVKLPIRIRAPFIASPGTVSMVLRETPQESVGVLMADGTIRREGRIGTNNIKNVTLWRDQRLINLFKSSTALSVRDGNGEERIVATADYFGPVSVADDGQAVFEQRLPDGRRVVNHYDPKSSKIRPLTSGGQEYQPLIHPDGSRFSYIDGGAQRSLKLCDLPDGSKCSSLFGPGVDELLGASPGGGQIVLSVREGARSRLRVLSLADGALQDLGPITYHCPVRWDGDARFWTYARTVDFSGWTEFDVRSGRPTGNKKPQDPEQGADCPPPQAAPGALKRALSAESELWRVSIDD
jgi:hypothetical protein